MKRECTYITKGDRGWYHIVTLTPEQVEGQDLREMEKFLSCVDRGVYYDVRIHDETRRMWIKKKDLNQINYVTKRDNSPVTGDGTASNNS